MGPGSGGSDGGVSGGQPEFRGRSFARKIPSDFQSRRLAEADSLTRIFNLCATAPAEIQHASPKGMASIPAQNSGPGSNEFARNQGNPRDHQVYFMNRNAPLR